MKLRGDRCQCTACGEYFNSTAAFDKHRRGKPTNRYCLSPEAMLDKAMSKNKAGFWITRAMDRLDKVRPQNNADTAERK